MEKYISKSALVAEIERQRKIYMYDVDNKHSFGRMTECNDLLVFLDTLETKEVDLENAFIEKVWDWVEDNLLSSNQQDNSRLYFEQFKKYMKGE